MADDETSTDDGHEGDPTDAEDLTGDDDTGSDESDGDEAGGATDDWTPPSKEEWEKQQSLLKARNAKLAEARKRAAAAERRAAGTATKTPAKKKGAQPPEGPDAGDEDDDDAAAAAEEAAAERVRVSQVRAAAVGALLAAGFTGDRRAAKDMVRLMDLGEVVPDAEGDVDDDDLVDTLDAFKERFPQMFQQAPTNDRRPARRPTTADRTTSDRQAPAVDATARMSRKLLKQGGYR